MSCQSKKAWVVGTAIATAALMSTSTAWAQDEITEDYTAGMRNVQVTIPVAFMSVGLGANYFVEEGLDFDDFNQFLELEPGPFISFGTGVILTDLLGDGLDVKVGVDINRRVLAIEELGNQGAPGVLPLSGDLVTYDLLGRLDLEWNIDDEWGRTLLRPHVGINFGAAFQDLEAFNAAGVSVLTGNGITPTVRAHAGFKVPLSDSFALGLEGYVSWTGGVDVSAGPGVTSSMDDRIESGFMLRGEILLGQFLDSEIFTDGFESGNVSVWSNGN